MNFHGHIAGLNVLKARIESMHYYVWTSWTRPFLKKWVLLLGGPEEASFEV